MRTRLAVVLVCLVVSGVTFAIPDGDPPAPAKPALDRHLAMTPAPAPVAAPTPAERDLELEARRAVKRGLEYLRSTQNDDGSWTDIIGRKVHYDYRGNLGKHVGVTALACMAFLANGSLPGRGEYSEQIERGLDFILKNVQHNGFITNQESRMYSHAFATLFLAEVYGMTGMDSVGRKLKQSISLIVEAQNKNGGWRYQPGAPDADMSITVCQVMALRAANNAGIHVPKAVIDRAIDYVKNSYNHRYGAFNYQIEEGPGGRRQMSRHSFALTAAGVTALYGAGVYDDAHIESGLRYMRGQLSSWSRGPESRFDYYYGMYYGTQAAFQRGGDYWDHWQKKVWRDILRAQQRSGYWRDLVGRNYATAMACVILQIPYQYLPIFER
ncbi:MAG: prenyltransferase/squalene oxidase repeat-containing protein [Planctomycetota bacterium]